MEIGLHADALVHVLSPDKVLIVNRTRRNSSRVASLVSPLLVVAAGAALLSLQPFGCTLDSSGVEPSGAPGVTSSGTPAGSGGSGGAAEGASTSSAGGMGGAGGIGGGGGAGGEGGGVVVGFEWKATDPTKVGGEGGGEPCAAYTYALPDWLKFKSPTQDRSSQTSASSLCVGFSVDKPRARNVTDGAAAAGWGLSVESERRNEVLQSDSWNVPENEYGWLDAANDGENMDLETDQPDPASGMSAAKFTSPSTLMTGHHSRYFNVLGRVGSAWLRGEGPMGTGCKDKNGMMEMCYAHFKFANIFPFYVNVTGTTWHRVSIVDEQNYNAAIVLETRDYPVGAGVVSGITTMYAYAAQVEPDGAYPSSYIRTTTEVVTREAETLYSDNDEDLLPEGYLDLTMRFAPNFASGEQSVDEYQLFQVGEDSNGEDNRIFMRKGMMGMSTVVLVIDGVEVESDPIAFQREQELTIIAKNQLGLGLELKVEGADTGNGTKTGMPDHEIPKKEKIYILSTDGGAQECADLRYIHFQ